MKVEIYSKPACPFCVQAKNLAEQKGLEYEYKQLGIHFELHELLEKAPTARTFPQIFINGENIGGFTEFSKLHG